MNKPEVVEYCPGLNTAYIWYDFYTGLTYHEPIFDVMSLQHLDLILASRGLERNTVPKDHTEFGDGTHTMSYDIIQI